MIRDAVTCDRPWCLAMFLEPDELPEETSFETAVATAGWQHLPDGHACPACAAGTGPVSERGECGRCGGRTIDLPRGNTCQWCRYVQPYPEDVEADA